PKANPDDRPRVWVLRAGQAVAVEVEVGLSNGQMTEVVGGPVQMGEAVITDTLEGGGR
ncbi:MAG: efflux RND transporter periplasmic adaptor subunit, partial [Nitrospirae bacterium CG_4_8_14_3_um_filter_70_85]